MRCPICRFDGLLYRKLTSRYFTMNAGARGGRLSSLLHNCTIFSYTDDRSSTASHFRRMVSCCIRYSMLTTERVGIANVTFEPGCRNNWHIHHKGGQILLCTAGRGYYQEWGKPAQEMNPGDVINIAPEVKHWHGAAPDSWFSHLAVDVPAEGSSNEWLEPVKEEEYSKLK